METKGHDGGEWLVISVIGKDRPGIVASVSRLLFQSGCNIEGLSQTALLGQFAMVAIASVSASNLMEELRENCKRFSGESGLDVVIRKILPSDMVPYRQGEMEACVITVRGEDRPGLAYGISEVLAEAGVNITNLDARVAEIGGKTEYIQVYEVDIPKEADNRKLQRKLRERGEAMEVSVDLQHRGIFRAINQI
jgi:glycine cleavage system transcriptional repressor